MFGGLKGFLNPTPESRKENANYLKNALGVSDEEKFALYDLLFWLISCSGRIEADTKIDSVLKANYDMIHGVYLRLYSELIDGSSEEDDVDE